MATVRAPAAAQAATCRFPAPPARPACARAPLTPAAVPHVGRTQPAPLAVSSTFAAQRRMVCPAPAAAASQAQQPQQQQGPQELPASVDAFLAAFSQRSVEQMAACLAPDASYSNLSLASGPFVGRQAVQGALAALVRSAPASWRLVLGDAACTPSSAAIVWHFEDGAGRPVPFGRGLSFYRLDEAGLICSVTEAAEQVVKVPQAGLPALSAAAPILEALAPLLPAGLAPAGFATSPPPQQSFFGSSSSGSSSSGFSSRSGFSSSSGASSGAASFEPPRPRSSRTGASSGGASGETSGGGGGGSGPPGLGGLLGTWIKDVEASDAASYSRACDLMGLSGLQKTTATTLIEGLQIEARQGGAGVAVSYLTVVPFFKVTEAFTLDGAPTSQGRRDLRRGAQAATARLGGEGALEVGISWGEPNAGGVTESYRLLGEGGAALECVSTVTVAAGSVTTRTVYARSDRWTPRFQWNPFAALGGP